MITIKFLNDKPDLTFEVSTMKEAIEKAIKLHKSLSYADMSYANMSYANMSYADMHGANMSYANMSYANMSYANMSGADMHGANMHGANMSGANMDFSCWPIWCGSLKTKIDKRLFVQLLYHTIRAGQSVDDKEIKKLLNMKSVINLANQFHRVEECGKIEVAK